jgi:hypothetical protein
MDIKGLTPYVAGPYSADAIDFGFSISEFKGPRQNFFPALLGGILSHSPGRSLPGRRDSQHYERSFSAEARVQLCSRPAKALSDRVRRRLLIEFDLSDDPPGIVLDFDMQFFRKVGGLGNLGTNIGCEDGSFPARFLDVFQLPTYVVCHQTNAIFDMKIEPWHRSLQSGIKRWNV